MTAKQNGSKAHGEAVALPIVQPQDVHVINRLFQLRPPLQMRVGERGVRVAPRWQAEEPAIADACTVALKTDSGEGELVLSKPLLNLMLADLDPALSFDTLDGLQRAILVEYALGAGLHALEAAIGCAIAVTNVSWGGAAGRAVAGRTALPFTVQVDGLGEQWCVLRLPSADALRLVEMLDRTAPRERGLVDVPVPLNVRWAAVAMTVGELRSIAPGDIILVDNSCPQAGQAVAVIGEHLAAPVNVAADGFRLGGQPRRVRGSGLEWSLDRVAQGGGALASGRLDDTPVQVLFEYGSGEVALSEVSRLGMSATLPIGAPGAGGLDIVVNGALVGRGEPTQIGAAMGVRVTRVA